MSNTVFTPSGGEVNDNDDIEVDDTEGGVVLLEANRNRTSALIINTGDGDMRVTTDGSSPTTTHGKLVPKGYSLSLSSPDCSLSEVKAIKQGLENTYANASEIS